LRVQADFANNINNFGILQLKQLVPLGGRDHLGLAQLWPDLAQEGGRIIGERVTLGRAKDIGGRSVRDDRVAHQASVGGEALGVLRMIAEDQDTRASRWQRF